MPEKEPTTPFERNETDQAVLVKRSDKKDAEGNILEHGKVQVMKHATDAEGNHYGYFPTEDGRIGHKKLSESYFGADKQAELEALALERGDLTREQIEQEIRHEILVEKVSEELAEEAFVELGPNDPSGFAPDAVEVHSKAEWSAMRQAARAQDIIFGHQPAITEMTPRTRVPRESPKIRTLQNYLNHRCDLNSHHRLSIVMTLCLSAMKRSEQQCRRNATLKIKKMRQ